MSRVSLRSWQLLSNIVLAGSSFLLAYLLLQQAPAMYGHFAFVWVLQAFGMALLNALIASPLLILMNAKATAECDNLEQQAAIKGYWLIALGLNSVNALLQGAYLWWVTSELGLALLFALAAWLQLLRGYGRLEWQNRDVKVLLGSDLCFSLVICVGAVLLWWFSHVDLWRVGTLLIIASLGSLWPFGRGFSRLLSIAPDWPAVKQGYDQQGKPALFGVLTVEATANFHSYLVVFASGSTAFAPLAAAMLYFRPLAVVLGSLQQSERPLFVQAQRRGDQAQVLQLRQRIRKMAITAFLLNTLLVVVLMLGWPLSLWPDPASQSTFVFAIVLWSLVALLRALRSSATALLQAANQFRRLAHATYASAALTMPAVWFCWWLAGPVASLVGVLLGELLLGLWLWRAQQQWLGNFSVSPKERSQ